MSIDAIGATSTSQTETSRQTLADNFDTFLTLLTAQLANQDPLDPMDSSKFTEQLVQYSAVEQQIATNEKLDELNASITQQIAATSAGAALAFMGQTAEFDSPVIKVEEGGGATWRYALGDNATSTKLVIKNEAGTVVYETTGALSEGAHSFEWDGKTKQGDPVPAGNYTLSVVSTDGEGEKVETAVAVREKITGVDLTSGVASVITASGRRTFDSIIKIEED